MKVSDCIHGCQFLIVRKYGKSRSNQYRCTSPNAPEKKGFSGQHVPGYLLYKLKSCPEGGKVK